MYIEDGSSYGYFERKKKRGLYSWGWLGDTVPEDKLGWTDAELKQKVIERLNSFSGNTADENCCRVDLYCGFDTCALCSKQGYSILEGNWPDRACFCGSLRLEHNSKVYVSPWNVQHYIEAHDYKPSDEVIDAIFNGRPQTWAERDKIALEKAHEEIMKDLKREREEEKRREAARPQWLKDYEKESAAKIKELRKNKAFVRM